MKRPCLRLPSLTSLLFLSLSAGNPCLPPLLLLPTLWGSTLAFSASRSRCSSCRCLTRSFTVADTYYSSAFLSFTVVVAITILSDCWCCSTPGLSLSYGCYCGRVV